MLTHSTGINLPTCGSGRGKIWLDNVRCTGTEGRITDCTNAGWGDHNCGHHEDAACRCCAAGETCSERACIGKIASGKSYARGVPPKLQFEFAARVNKGVKADKT